MLKKRLKNWHKDMKYYTIFFDFNYKTFNATQEFTVVNLGEKDVTFKVGEKEHILPYVERMIGGVLMERAVYNENNIPVASITETISPEEKEIIEQILQMPMTTKEEILACKEASRVLTDSVEKVYLFNKLIWAEKKLG